MTDVLAGGSPAVDSRAAPIARGVLQGQVRAIAQAISAVESSSSVGRCILHLLRPHAGRAHLLGVTGAPGAGKSTLINRLVAEFRARGRTVGVVAVDPSSPFTGGAILGDRVRMQSLALDPGVFVRSMATRGRLGGLGGATEDAVTILDASGKDVVVVETVGVGQDEVDVAGTAQTTIVVVAPGMGDEVQALKAGVLEVGDIFVVNKADLDGADSMARHLATIAESAGVWTRPIIKAVATRGDGVAELADAVQRHRDQLPVGGRGSGLKGAVIRKRILAIAELELLDRLERRVGPGTLERLVDQVATGSKDAHVAAELLVRDLLDPNGPEAKAAKRRRTGTDG